MKQWCPLYVFLYSYDTTKKYNMTNKTKETKLFFIYLVRYAVYNIHTDHLLEMGTRPLSVVILTMLAQVCYEEKN